MASNGELDEAVRPNWNGFVEQNTKWDKTSITLEMWTIDKLVDEIQRSLFDEHIFDRKMQGLLRKALYFIGEGDYKNDFFEKIIDQYIRNFEECSSSKKFDREASSMYMASQMIAQYAADSKNYKISIMVSEYLIIKYWQYLLKNNKFEKISYCKWILRFCSCYEKWNDMYAQNIEICCMDRYAFPRYNNVEQRVMLYEVMGYLTSYAYYLYDKDIMKENKNHDKSNKVLNQVVNLINNYPQIMYPPYDNNIGVISMLFRLLSVYDRTDEIEDVLQRYCMSFIYNYRRYKKYPSSIDSFADAVNIEFGNDAYGFKSSGMWGMFLLWIALMDNKRLYDEVFDFVNTDLKFTTNCLWFLRANEEEMFYDKYAMNVAGEGFAVKVDKEFNTFKENIMLVLNQYSGEKFSYDTYSFKGLEFITCRYFGYIPSAQYLSK